MRSILEHLYRCAMENQKRYLDRDELREYRTVSHEEENLRDELKGRLQGESLHLFELYIENCNEQSHLDEYSSFRVGLAIGLKLGAFSMSDY